MPRSLPIALLLIFFAAFSAAAQSTDTSSSAPPAPAQAKDSAPPADAQKPRKIWTNENLSGASGSVSVVGDTKAKTNATSSKPADAGFVASARKQLEKIQGQIDDIDKQLVDLKNFSEGEPSTSASGIKLNKSYQREPIEVQMRALRDKKKELQAKIEALLDEARKKGVEPGQLR
jgi:hypothetical protein